MVLFEYRGYYVSFRDYVGEGYYCQIYSDNWMCYEVDSYIIRKSQLAHRKKEEVIKEYIDDNIQNYTIIFEIIK